MSDTCQTCSPALDYPADSPYVVAVPDAFLLPQTNPYSGDITVEQITLLIAAFCQLAGTNPSPSEMVTNAAEYDCLPQSSQIAAAIYQLNQILLNIPPGTISTAGGFVYTGNWSGTTPPFTPPSSGAIGIDSGTLRQWQYTTTFGWT